LRKFYYGPCINVVRSSDSTARDIYFGANGVIDTNELLSFVGTGTGTIAIWYDQSGGGWNASQSTIADQPIIVSSGALSLKDYMICAVGNGNQYLTTSASIPLPTGAAPGALNVVVSPGYPSSSAYTTYDYFSYGANDVDELRGLGLSAYTGKMGFGFMSYGPDIAAGAPFTGVPAALVYSYDGTTISAIQDGTLLASKTGTLTTPSSALGIFTRANNLGRPLPGEIFECIAFASDLSASQLDLLSTNQSRFYW
jgi:hypothetical protein